MQSRSAYTVFFTVALFLIALLLSLEDTGRFLNRFGLGEIPEVSAQVNAGTAAVVPRADVDSHGEDSRAFASKSESPNAMKPLRACTSARAERQVKLMPTLKINGCGSRPDGLYLRTVHMVNPNARVLVDIGSNKGYTGIQLLALWTNARVAPGRLHTVHKTGPYANRSDVVNCGMCMDCREPVPSALVARSEAQSMGPLGLELWNKYRARNKSITVESRVLSFDGNAILVGAVNSAIARLRVGEWWQAETAAFNDKYEAGKTIKFIVNNEFGHIVDGAEQRETDMLATAQVVEAPLLTVDEMCRRKGVGRIDLLKIDTEGFDAFVLRGASAMMSRNAVDIVLFEYNTFWPFDTHTLASTTRWLHDEFGFECFMEASQLLRLTGGCWDARFETKQWSNVWCASPRTRVGSAVAHLFDRLSV